jgi:hypothetical protein
MEVTVTVEMNPLELVLFRRALARAADEGQIEATEALGRICQLDSLRWDAEEKAAGKKPPAREETEQLAKVALHRLTQ